MKKKIISAIVLFGVVGALGSGAAFTSAYLISGDKEVNSFNATKVDMGIEEDYNKPSNPQPGDVISKKPRAVNNSSIDVYVRMRAEVSNADLLEPIVANSGWTLKSDGFYYYNKVLKPGEKTNNLFESVTIKKNCIKEEIKDLSVQVYAEAVQAGTLSADQAWATMD